MSPTKVKQEAGAEANASEGSKETPKVPSTNGTKSRGTKLKIKKEEQDDFEITGVDAKIPATSGEDMFDDVDDPEIVDLTYEGIAEINGVDHFVCEDFKIPQIPKPFIVTRPLQSLFDCIESGHIVLNPDYQREVVWDEGRASLLITSILMGYFIPPIIFNVKTEIIKKNGKKEPSFSRICVDGKQRLTSVYKFMTGQIGFFDSNSPQKKWFFCHPVVNGRETASNHNILPKAVKEFFVSQAFCCYEYADLKLETEETMFQLVQRGIALTPAEKMRAMSTEWATFTKMFEDDYTLIVNLSKQSRASGFRLVLTIFTMIQEVMSGKRKRSTAPTLQASPQVLLKVLEDKTPISDALKFKFKAIFDRYENLVKLSSTQITATRFKVNINSVFDPAPDFLRTPGVEHVRTFSPLELIATAILVSCRMDHRTDAELLEDAKSMRYYLRVKHKDLRVNAQCWVTVWEYVTEEMNRRRILDVPPAAGGSTVLGAVHALRGFQGTHGMYASPYASPIAGIPLPGSTFSPLLPRESPGSGSSGNTSTATTSTRVTASPGAVSEGVLPTTESAENGSAGGDPSVHNISASTSTRENRTPTATTTYSILEDNDSPITFSEPLEHTSTTTTNDIKTRPATLSNSNSPFSTTKLKNNNRRQSTATSAVTPPPCLPNYTTNGTRKSPRNKTPAVQISGESKTEDINLSNTRSKRSSSVSKTTSPSKKAKQNT